MEETYGGYRFRMSGRYYLSTKDIDGKRRWLHQYKYEQEHGVIIPEGYEIHHADHNRSNNDIGNLELLSNDEHNKRHADASCVRGRSDRNIEHLEQIRELAALAKRGLYRGEKQRRKERVEDGVFRTCKQCSEEFRLNKRARLDDTKFCSKECAKTYWQSKRRKTLVEVLCKQCGQLFRRGENGVKGQSSFCSEPCRSQNTKDRDKFRHGIKRYKKRKEADI